MKAGVEISRAIDRLQARPDFDQLWGLKPMQLRPPLAVVAALEGADPVRVEPARLAEFFAEYSQGMYSEMWRDVVALLGARSPERYESLRDALGLEPLQQANRRARKAEKIAGERREKIRAKTQVRIPLPIARRMPFFARRRPDASFAYHGYAADPISLTYNDPWGEVTFSGFWPTPDHFRSLAAATAVAQVLADGEAVLSCSVRELTLAYTGGTESRQTDRRIVLRCLSDLAAGHMAALAEREGKASLDFGCSPIVAVEAVCDDGEVRPLGEALRGHQLARIANPLRITFADWYVGLSSRSAQAGNDYTLLDLEVMRQIPARALATWKQVHSLVPKTYKDGRKQALKWFFYVSETAAPTFGRFQPLNERRRSEIRRIEKHVEMDLKAIAEIDSGIGLTTCSSNPTQNGYQYFYVAVGKQDGKRLRGAHCPGRRRCESLSRGRQREQLLGDPVGRRMFDRRHVSKRWRVNEHGGVEAEVKRAGVAQAAKDGKSADTIRKLIDAALKKMSSQPGRSRPSTPPRAGPADDDLPF